LPVEVRNRFQKGWLIVLASLAGAVVCPAGETAWRGITISCQTYGKEWATPEMKESLVEIKSMGANAFAIHPYARINGDGSIHFPDNPAQDWIVKPARWAREMNLTLMLAPHLAYWGSPFEWRGAIKFDSEGEWDRFFADYSRWMLGLAEVCEREGIPLLCIGLEYSHATQHEQRWRELIGKIRAVYKGKITYGSNWNEYRDLKFWDALDYVGILAYFPLATPNDPAPDEQKLREAWQKWLAELKTYSEKMKKPVVFTELGYNESSMAAAHPWAYPTGGPDAVGMQKRCLKIALEETGGTDFLAGVFLWKWFPGLLDLGSENFDLRKPTPKAVIHEVWGGRVAPAS